MPDAVKNIIFRTTVDNAQSVQLLDQFGNAIKKTEAAIGQTAATTTKELSPALQNVSRRDLGIFASQLLNATGATGRLGSQLSNLATGLAMGGTIGAAFAGFAALINYLTTESVEAKKAADALIASLKEVIKVKTPGGFFNVDPAKIPEAIALLKKEREAQADFAKSWLEENPNAINLEVYDESIKLLQEIQVKEEQRLMINELLSKAGLTWVESQKESTKEIGKQKEHYENIANIISGGLRGTPEGGRAGGRRGKPQASSLFGDGAKGAMIDTKETENKFRDMVTDWTSILQSEFSQFWVETFGEANSLLEKLLQVTFTSILADIAGSFLSFLPGGSIIGGIVNAFSGGAGGATQPMQVNVNLGGETLARVYLDGKHVAEQRRLN